MSLGAVDETTMDEASYIRLHITPFTSSLLKILLPTSLQAKVRNISYHAIQTFPEHTYGYLELPRCDAERMKKKLQGCIVQGHKIRIETARPRRQSAIDSEPSPLPVLQTNGRKKRTRDEIPGVDIGDRHVKRGWTTPAHEIKKATIKLLPKTVVRSKYTNRPECLFKTTLPANHAYHNRAIGKMAQGKRRNENETMVHEFANTTKYATFLRDRDAGNTSNPVTEYVKGKGWIDENGSIIEEDKISKRPTREPSNFCTRQSPKSLSVPRELVDENRSSDDYSSSGEDCYESSHVDSLEKRLDEMELDAQIPIKETVNDVMYKSSSLTSSSSISSSSMDGSQSPSSSSESSSLSESSDSNSDSDSESDLNHEVLSDENKQFQNRNSVPSINSFSSSLSPSSTSSTPSGTLSDEEEENKDEGIGKENEEEDEDEEGDEDEDDEEVEEESDDDDSDELDKDDGDELIAGDEKLLQLENKNLSGDFTHSKISAKGQLSIKAPSDCHGRLKAIHPLELLYKNRATSQEQDMVTDRSKNNFAFFPADGERQDDIDPSSPIPSRNSIASPLTPFTQQYIERRTVRSPAPTPDTAHLYRHIDWPTDDDENLEKSNSIGSKDRMPGPEVNGTNHATSSVMPESEPTEKPSEFENWFWKNQGKINRTWKQRRKIVLKEHRQRDNRKRLS